MRLRNACVLALAARGATSVHGFQLAPSPSRASPSTKAAATAVGTVADAETSSADASGGITTFADVNQLAFRALQRECKSLGLEAVGTTAALRGRLLDHLGLTRDAGPVAEVPKATAAEIEVRTVVRNP